jgi:hypothetical protein
MNTRSKTALKKTTINVANSDVTIKYTNIVPLYEVNIDFNEASEAWKANKKYIGNGFYKYVCCGITKTGNKCNRKSLDSVDFCKIHIKKKL